MSAFDDMIAAEEARMPFEAGKEPGEQGSLEWLMERVGHCTASRFRDVMDRLKSGAPGAKRTAYLWELVCERLTGKPAQHYTSAAMQHGTDNEAAARMAYEAKTGAIVTQVGFRKHPVIAWVGGSADGIIEPDGGWEGKCPFNSQHHLICFLSGMPTEHMPQVQGLIWLHGAQWWDFTSFDPRMPPAFQLYIQRVPRDDAYIAKLSAAVEEFLGEVQAQVTELHKIAATREVE